MSVPVRFTWNEVDVCVWQ